jgi:serine/threonine protein kinase
MVSAKHVDHRTDVWALAAVAYEALTGERPFQGRSIGAQIPAVHSGGVTKPSVVGKNGYPIAKAAQIAFRAAVEHLAERARSVELISFVLYSPTELMAFASALASNASTLPGRTRD